MIIAYVHVSCAVLAVYLFLGFFIYKIDQKNKLNRDYLFLNLCLALASYLNITIVNVQNTREYILWNAFGVFSWCVYTCLILYLSLLLTNKAYMLKGKWKYLFWTPVPVITLMEAFLFPYLKTRYIPVYYFLIILENVFYFAYPIWGVKSIFIWGKNAKLSRERKQSRLIVAASLAAMVLSLANAVVYQLHIGIPDMTNIVSLIPDLAVWYAIVKYGLIDIISLISTKDVLSKVDDMIFLIDENECISYVNKKCEEVLDYKAEELSGCHASKAVSPWSPQILLPADKPDGNNRGFYCISKSGRKIPVSIQASLIDNGSENILIGTALVCKDMTLIQELEVEIEERKQKEEELNYLSFHDTVTGLYNRRYFEKQLEMLNEKRDFSVGIIMCDIDGLKLVNDAMGHRAGDELLIAFAGIITKTFQNRGIVSRIGGDEFAVLIYRTEMNEMKSFCKMISDFTEQSNTANQNLKMSISIGFAIAPDNGRRIVDFFKEADNNMYREKLNHINSARSSMIQGLAELLKARDYITEGHAERIKDMVLQISSKIGLGENRIIDLTLLAKFHDIGKVSIPDRILFKKGALTTEEMAEMQRHSEIGYRISKTIPELRPVSEFILKHHERWDGKGYPLGMKGYDIPLECRILSIVDAYDAMTHDRPYRKAMSQRAALDELKRCAGTQFDPKLVEELLQLLGSNQGVA